MNKSTILFMIHPIEFILSCTNIYVNIILLVIVDNTILHNIYNLVVT